MRNQDTALKWMAQQTPAKLAAGTMLAVPVFFLLVLVAGLLVLAGLALAKLIGGIFGMLIYFAILIYVTLYSIFRLS